MWNYDLTSAPRGKDITVTETVKGEKRERQEFQHEWVWIADAEGRVVRTRWLPPTRFSKFGRWDGYNVDTKIILAWAPYIVPEHPGNSVIVHRHSEINLPIIEDVGSGA